MSSWIDLLSNDKVWLVIHDPLKCTGASERAFFGWSTKNFPLHISKILKFLYSKSSDFRWSPGFTGFTCSDPPAFEKLCTQPKLTSFFLKISSIESLIHHIKKPNDRLHFLKFLDFSIIITMSFFNCTTLYDKYILYNLSGG